jgi:hypothetical protein
LAPQFTILYKVLGTADGQWATLAEPTGLGYFAFLKTSINAGTTWNKSPTIP